MPKGYLQIPDWFSFENQGGNIAVADLTSTGKQDLLVIAVDNPAGQNRGVYRIGRALDAKGIPGGGWTPWIDVPDWFSFENQGVGAAIADVDHDGQQDLIVLMIDSPPGRNRGLYRIGRQLDSNGNVAAGWGPWIEVPDWFSFDNQHCAVAAADLDGDGNLELIVAMIDDPAGPNRALYRIGRKLDADGSVDEWTPWLEVPGWFSWDNQGLGIAVIRNGADADLAVFQIDNAIDQNQAFYKVGSQLHVNGNVGEWGPWQGVPAWFAWENQGGGISPATIGGARFLVVMLVDGPIGQNAGYYRLLPLDTVPARDGQWKTLGFHSEVLPVHLALLPKGKVLVFAGSGSSATRFNAPDFGDVAQGIFTSVVWDPTTAFPGNFVHPPTLDAPNHRPFDFFCGGDTFLADGRLLSAGGTGHYNPFTGRKDACVFDPATQVWSFVAPMAHGRWYPTLITLGDGHALAATGLAEDGTNLSKNTLELYDSAHDKWKTLHFPPGFAGLPLYAHLFQMADGRVLFSGGRMDDALAVDPCIIDLTQDPVHTNPVFGMAGGGMRNQSASVLLPPAQDQRVMIMGGGPAGKPNKTDAIDNVDIVDLKDPNPHFVAAAPLNLPRLHLNAVLLPDRTVFVTGGSLKQEDAPLARLQPEIYDPAADTWTPMAASTFPRLYHSTAVLLPDARVLSAGGNPEGGTHVQWDQDPEEEMRLEVFSPPYLFRGPQPTITAAPAQCGYGQAIQISSPRAADIKWASLIRNCVTTHSFDGSQRLVDLPISSRAGGKVATTVPPNPNITPPGWYMLFLTDTDGVPSVASWVQVG
jgi:Domain of unknown function (DUF1929)/Kelch motif